MRNEIEMETAIQAKGLNAPRLKPSDIDKAIKKTDYHVFKGTALTVCAITLQNGFHVVGTSAAASIENFDEDIGRKIAFDNARNKIWELEGYRLRQMLFEDHLYQNKEPVEPEIGEAVQKGFDPDKPLPFSN